MRRLSHRPACARLALAAALTLGSAAPAAPLPYYRAIALPELSPQGPAGEGWTLGWALNDAGLVVGGTQRGSAVQWSAADGLRRLGGTGGAYAVAPDGTAVGWVDLGAGLSQTAARWSPGTGLQALSDVYPGAAIAGFGLAVNDAGWVLSGSTSGNVQLLRPGQAPLDLGPIADGGLSLQANPVLNAGGMVAGTLATLVAGQSIQQGWLWTASAGAHSFSAIAGQGTRLTGLNDLGSAVGWVTPLAGGGPGQGLLYDANTRNLTQLLPGFLPDDINNSGLMVGSLASQDLAAAWVNGAALNLNAYTASLGDYTLTQAVDVNNRGQILAIGRATPANPATFTGPALRTFLLTECTRCGQIAPYPNPAGTTLDVGPDWFDAHNALSFDNHGRLLVGTTLANRSDGRIENQGELLIQPAGGELLNSGVLTTAASGITTLDGRLTNTGLVQTDGLMRVRDGGTLQNAGLLAVRPGGRLSVEGGTVNNEGRVWVTKSDFDIGPQGSFLSLAENSSFLLAGGRADIQGDFRFGTHASLTLDALDGTPADMQVARVTLSLLEARLELLNGSALRVDGANSLLSATLGTVSVQGGSLLVIGREAQFAQLGGSLDIVGEGAAASGSSEMHVFGSARLGGVTSVGSGVGTPGRLVAENGQLAITHELTVGLSGRLWVYGNGSSLIVEEQGVLASSGRIELNQEAELTIDGGRMHLARFGRLHTTGQATLRNFGQLYVANAAAFKADQRFVQESGVTTVDGVLEAPEMRFQSGQLRGSGTLRGNVFVFSNGLQPAPELHVGNSPGTLTIDGNLSLDGASFEMELGEHAQDQLIVTGHLDLGRLSVALRPYGGYLPDLDDRFSFIRAGAVTPLPGGSQVSVDTSALGDGWVQQLTLGSEGLQTTLDNSQAVQIRQMPGGQTVQVATGSIAFGRELRVAGRLEVAGSMTNRLLAADPLTGDSPPGAPMVVEAGATLDVQPGGRFSNRTTLNNEGLITNAGRFEHRAGAELTNAGTLENRGLWRNDGSLFNTGTLINAAGGRFEGAGLVANWGRIDNDGDFLVQGRLENGGEVVNHAGGRFTVAAGASFASPAGTGSFVQQAGGSTVVDGLMSLGTPGLAFNARFDGGTLGGAGTLSADSLLGGGVTLLPGGDGIGTLTLAGTLVLTGAVLALDVATAGADLLDLTAAQLLAMAGPLDIRLRFGVGDAPAAGRSYTLLLMGDPGQLNLAGVSVVAEVAQASDGSYVTWTPSAGEQVRLAFEGNSLRYEVQAVPEPQPWMLMAGGLLAVGAFKRRAGRR